MLQRFIYLTNPAHFGRYIHTPYPTRRRTWKPKTTLYRVRACSSKMSTLIPKRAWRALTPSQLSRRAASVLSPISANAPIYRQGLHTSQRDNTKPKNPDPRENPAIETKLPRDTNVGQKFFADFSLRGKVFIVTGGAQGLGLALAEGLVEAGGKGVYSPYY